jgi:hypothetical protein
MKPFLPCQKDIRKPCRPSLFPRRLKPPRLSAQPLNGDTTMPEVDHYRFQADRARRMADRVSDSLVREKLLEMASEFGRYAALIESKAREKMAHAATA